MKKTKYQINSETAFKQILVSVDEFRDNGGTFTKGIVLFNDIGDEEVIYECDYGSKKIICYDGGIASEIYNTDAFVKINCIPIYQTLSK